MRVLEVVELFPQRSKRTSEGAEFAVFLFLE
jgi:hypothetical protein